MKRITAIGERQKKASRIYRPFIKTAKNRLRKKPIRISGGKGPSIFGRMINGIKSWFGWRLLSVVQPRQKQQVIVPTHEDYHKGCFGNGKRFITWRSLMQRAEEMLEKAKAGKIE